MRFLFLILILAGFIYSGFVILTHVPAYIWIILFTVWVMYKEIKEDNKDKDLG